MVEAFGHIARHLQVLLLVLAHGHMVRIVQQDVRGHEHRVAEEPSVHILEPVGLVLEAVCQRQARIGEEAAEVPAELRGLGHVALPVEHGAGGVQSTGQPRCGHAMGVRPQHGRVLDLGQGMQVGDEQEGLVAGVVAERDRGADGAQHVAQVGRAGALYAGEDAGHGRRRYQ